MSAPDPAAWPSARLRDEVAFALSPIGRQRREDREVAFALEIQRLRAENQRLQEAQETARERGFDLGFHASKPDWNGMRPGDSMTTVYYRAVRSKAIACALTGKGG